MLFFPEPASMFTQKTDFHIRGLITSASTDFLQDLLEEPLAVFSKEGSEQQTFQRFFSSSLRI